MSRLNNPKGTVNIGLVGKYIELQDAYISINEALKHAGVSLEQAVNIKKRSIVRILLPRMSTDDSKAWMVFL